MNTSKIIKGVVSNGRYTVTAPIVKEDYGLYLQIEGVELPSTYEVDFSNSENSGSSVTMIGNADGVLIPRQFISTGKDVFAFLYHVGADYGRTVYKFRIPNKLRPDRTNEEPTPEEQSVIDQAISALNEAVAQTAQDVESADQSAQSAQGYAERAESARDTAQTYANNAQTSATSAQTSASQASASASASAQSASEAETARQETTSLVAEAQRYANASEQSATASANSAEQAESAKGVAQSYAQDAQTSATYASMSESTAISKATEASGYADTASAKALESAQSATNAQTYATQAESAKTASQTAQGLAESARDSAISAKNDAEQARADAESARDEAQQAVASISGALDDKADIITDTASGSIASFSDGADNLPLKSLVVNIDPVQDLHGQESPYPAGGGKNLLNVTASTSTVNGVTYTVESDGTIKLSGTATERSVFKIAENFTLKAGTYKLNGSPQTIPVYCYLNFNGGGISASETVNSFDVLFTLTEDVTTDYVRLDIASGTNTNGLVFKPMIRLSSVTDATYAPYENICPISGWDEVKVLDDPSYGGTIKWNQLFPNPEDWQAHSVQTQLTLDDGVITATLKSGSPSVYAPAITLQGGEVITTVANHKYFASCQFKPATNGTPYFRNNTAFANSYLFGFNITPAGMWGDYANIMTATSTGGVAWYIGQGGETSSIAVGDSISIKNMMCIDLTEMFGAGNEPSTVEAFKALFPKDYYPYDEGETTTVSAVNGDPYRHVTIDLGQTVYGGHLDVVTGELVVDRAMVDLGTIDNWRYSLGNTGAFDTIVALTPLAKSNTKCICSQYKTLAYPNQGNITNSDFCVGINKKDDGSAYTRTYVVGALFVKDSRYSDVEVFKTAMNGVMLCYELTEPIEIQLSANQINSLYGVNNLWADSGDTEVVYRADTKLYIERLTAPEEDDMIADANITSGKYFMVGNSLYKATANIANGAQIIVGTNCIRKSLSEALNEINA